jgi:hypothetical protein
VVTDFLGVSLEECARTRVVALTLPARIAAATDPEDLRALLAFGAKREAVREQLLDLIRTVDHCNRSHPGFQPLEADPDGTQHFCAVVMGLDWDALELEARS